MQAGRALLTKPLAYRLILSWTLQSGITSLSPPITGVSRRRSTFGCKGSLLAQHVIQSALSNARPVRRQQSENIVCFVVSRR